MPTTPRSSSPGDGRNHYPTVADAEAVAAVYGHHVLHGTGTFEEEPPLPDEMARRMAEVSDAGWPWLVAEQGVAGSDGVVLGYAYAARFKPRAGYRISCEDSLYVAADAMGLGVGTMLLAALMAAARKAGFIRMFAVIGDADNAASIRLHARAGFRQVGLLEKVGTKFGREIDVVFMQRELG